MKVIVAALKIEVSFILKQMRKVKFSQRGTLKKYYGELAGIELLIVITGVGKEWVCRSLETLFETENPRHLLSIGYGGGLAPSLKTGDIGFVRMVSGPGPVLELSIENHFQFPEIHLYTADEVIRFPHEKLELHQKHGVQIVEMETYYLVQKALSHGVPVTCLRIVIDAQTDPIHEFDFLTPDGRILAGKFLKFMWKKPGSIMDMAELQRKGSLVSRKIAEIAQDWAKIGLDELR